MINLDTASREELIAEIKSMRCCSSCCWWTGAGRCERYWNLILASETCAEWHDNINDDPLLVVELLARRDILRAARVEDVKIDRSTGFEHIGKLPGKGTRNKRAPCVDSRSIQCGAPIKRKTIDP